MSSSASSPSCPDPTSLDLTPSDVRRLVPPLTTHARKGQMGRVAILGGSPDYTGAPYYAGISSLKVGADLTYVLTAEEAAGPIKSYSPELMVTPVYSAKQLSSHSTAKDSEQEEESRMANKAISFLDRTHVLVIGPGLGRDERVLNATARVIAEARERRIPLVIDADGLWLLAKRPDVIRGYRRALLTPNTIEFARLQAGVRGDAVETALPPKGAPPGPVEVSALSSDLGGPCVLLKGSEDVIADAQGRYVVCYEKGSLRRSGGLGDILAGTAGTMVHWASMAKGASLEDSGGLLLAAYAACLVARRAGARAFAVHKRATTAPDAIAMLGEVMEELAPVGGGDEDP